MKKSIDEPTFIILGLKNKNRRDAAAVSNAVFYRRHVFSVQSNIRTDRFNETDVNTDYTHHKNLPAKEELFYCFRKLSKDITLQRSSSQLDPRRDKKFSLYVCDMR